MSPVAAVARADARAFARDPLLRAMLLAPVGLVGLLTVGVPLLEGWLGAAYDVDLAPHRPVAVALLAAVCLPLLFGAFAGFLLLEDRESNVLPAIAVSPAGRGAYLVVRCGWAGLAAAVTIAGALALDGGLALVAVGAVAVLGGGAASVLALAIGVLAADRLAGLAVSKAISLPLMAVLATWVVDAPWSWALAVLPTYAPVTALFAGAAGDSLWPALAVGTIQLPLLAWWCGRRLASRGA